MVIIIKALNCGPVGGGAAAPAGASTADAAMGIDTVPPA